MAQAGRHAAMDAFADDDDCDLLLQREMREFARRVEHGGVGPAAEACEQHERDCDVAMQAEGDDASTVLKTDGECVRIVTADVTQAPMEALRQWVTWSWQQRADWTSELEGLTENDAYVSTLYRTAQVLQQLVAVAQGLHMEVVETGRAWACPETAMAQMFARVASERAYAVMSRHIYVMRDGFAHRDAALREAVLECICTQSPYLHRLVRAQPYLVDTVLTQLQSMPVPPVLTVDVNAVLYDNCTAAVTGRGIETRPTLPIDASRPITPRARLSIDFTVERGTPRPADWLCHVTAALVLHTSSRDDRWLFVAVTSEPKYGELVRRLNGYACGDSFVEDGPSPVAMVLAAMGDDVTPAQLGDIQRAVHERVPVLVVSPHLPPAILRHRHLRHCVVQVDPDAIPPRWLDGDSGASIALQQSIPAYVAVCRQLRALPYPFGPHRRPDATEPEDLVVEMLQDSLLALVPRRHATLEAVTEAYIKYRALRGCTCLPDVSPHHVQRAVSALRESHPLLRALPCVDYVAASRVFVNLDAAQFHQQ